MRTEGFEFYSKFQKGLEKNNYMITGDKSNGNGLTGVANEGTWPGIDSRFRLIIIAGLRTKQLLHGSKPRIEVDQKRRRNTSIALEEVKRGLVPFIKVDKKGMPIPDTDALQIN